MARKKKTPKPKKHDYSVASNGGRASVEKQGKKLDISAVSIVDNTVVSKNREIWAIYKVQNQAYDFLSVQGKVSLASNIVLALQNLVNNRQEEVDFWNLNTSAPLDVNLWSKQFLEETTNVNRPRNFYDFLNHQADFLLNQGFLTKVSYIGICLGKRGSLNMSNFNIVEAGFKGGVDLVKKWMREIGVSTVTDLSPDEELLYRNIEKEYFRTFSRGFLKAERATAEEILLLIKRQFYPAMPTPYLDVDYDNRLGSGDIVRETNGVIENHFRWLKFSQFFRQTEFKTYRATLTFSKFPPEVNFPGPIPFLYLPNGLTFPFSTFSRFTMIPTESMKKSLEKKAKEQKDELSNLSAGMDAYDNMISGGNSTGTFDAIQDNQEIMAIINSDKTPWTRGTYRLVVEAQSEEELRDMVTEVKDAYSRQDINLTWTSGDQLELFLEQMPGDRLRESSFEQTTNLAFFGASGFNFSSDVGDKIYGRELI